MGWTFFYLMVILKIPILALLGIVYWAINATDDEVADPPGEDDGGQRRPRQPRGPRPNAPRRGPHGDPAPGAPPRTRTPAVGRRARTPHEH